MTRLIVLLGLVWTVIAAPATMAQEYGPSLGDLRGVPPVAHAGDLIPLDGSGFAADSAVEVSLLANDIGEVSSLGTVAVDEDGNLDEPVLLSESVAPGTYTLSASGDTVDGGVRVLSAALNVAPRETKAAATRTDPDTTSEIVGEGIDAVTSDGDHDPGTVGEAGEDAVTAAGEAGGDSAGNMGTYLLGGIALLVIAVMGALWWRAREVRR
jgi:hypothetical protein